MDLFGIGSTMQGIMGLTGTLMTNHANAKMAHQARQAAELEAHRMREFQDDMSRTAHQREVEDLRLAGLNPILSGTGGPGAATPAGAAAQGIVGNPMQDPIASAIAARQRRIEQDNIEADTKLKDQQEDLAREQKHKTYQETMTQEEITKQAKSQAEIFAASAKGAKIEGEIDESKFGAFMRYLNRVNPFSSASGIGRAIGNR